MSRILVADNDVYVCGFISRILTKKRLGEFVEVVHDGVCAFDKLLSGKYDIAILDSSLPDLSGLKVIRRAKAEGIKTKMVVLSDRSDRLQAAEAMLSGAQDLIEKPILLDSFVYSLKKCIEQSMFDRYEVLHGLNKSLVEDIHIKL